jgi:hypothetical protein
MSSLWFNNVAMPTPAKNGIEIKKEKVWSKNTKRTANATMVGDIIAIKYTLSITWPPLSDSEVALIDSYLEPSFITVTFRDPKTGSNTTKTFYSGTPSYPVYSYANGVPTYNGVKVDLIQQ